VNPPISIHLRSNFYPGDGVGMPQPTDLISTSTSSYNPMFVKFDGTVAGAQGATTTNYFALQSTSPAIGAGNTSFPTFGGINYSPAALPNKDLGAYPLDGTGNKH